MLNKASMRSTEALHFWWTLTEIKVRLNEYKNRESTQTKSMS